MKLRIYIFILTASLFSSCSKDFLDQVPQDQLSSEAYYKNLSQVDKGIIGCYVPLQNFYNGGNVAWTLGLISDEFSPWKNQSNVAVAFNIDGFTKNLSFSQGGIWSNAYVNIQRCNRMIQVINDGDFTVNAGEESLLQSYLGEARFIRALNYFVLVQLYGDVPMVTMAYEDPNDAVGIGRTAVSKIYSDIIIPDFKFAGENCRLRNQLPANQLGRVTSGAGYTMLGKAYLTLGMYPEAEAALKNVINSQQYVLLPQLGSIFDVKNENNQESVFEVQYDETLEDGSTYQRWVGYEAAPLVGTLGSNESIWVSDKLIAQYKATNDLVRLNTWIVESVVNPANNLPIKDPFPKKLITLNTGLLNQNNNFIITRYADVILMYAEALIMQSPARASEIIDEFNKIRTRASMPILTSAQLTRSAILNERKMELAFEGHRWFDLLRTGTAIAVMSAELNRSIPENQLLFPVPNGEIQKDPSLSQNTGY